MTLVCVLKRLLTTFILLFAGSLISCVAWKSQIRDLTIVGIESVDLSSPSDGASWKVVPEGQGRPFLRVQLATSKDLVQLAKDRDVTQISSVLYFCDEGPDTRHVFTGGGIYTGESELWLVIGKSGPERDAKRDSDGKYLFSIVFENPAPIVMSEYVDGEQAQVGTVDVLKPPKPVCLHFYAGRMGTVGWVIESNVVLLPGENEQ